MAANLHIEALAWLRYVKQMPLVCTEVGGWNADVLGVCPNYSVEIEVKKSIADLRADFKNKRAKHWAYGGGGGGDQVPNYLYFIVPEVLKDKALVALEDLGPDYGLLWAPTLIMGHDYNSLGYGAGKNLVVERRATKLHDNKPTATLVRTVTRRLSSELVGLYQMHEQLQVDTMANMKDILANVRASAMAMAAAVPEPPEQFTEERLDDPPTPDTHPPE